MLDRMAAHFSDGRQDARSFPWHELTYAQVAEFRTLLGRQYAPRTANNYLSALKAVLRESKRLGLLDPATFETLTDQPPVRGETLPAGRHVQADELERCSSTWARWRRPRGRGTVPPSRCYAGQAFAGPRPLPST
jgi:hypothetical protein